MVSEREVGQRLVELSKEPLVFAGQPPHRRSRHWRGKTPNRQSKPASKDGQRTRGRPAPGGIEQGTAGFRGPAATPGRIHRREECHRGKTEAAQRLPVRPGSETGSRGQLRTGSGVRASWRRRTQEGAGAPCRATAGAPGCL